MICKDSYENRIFSSFMVPLASGMDDCFAFLVVSGIPRKEGARRYQIDKIAGIPGSVDGFAERGQTIHRLDVIRLC